MQLIVFMHAAEFRQLPCSALWSLLPSSALQGWLMPGGSPPVISASTRPSGASDR